MNPPPIGESLSVAWDRFKATPGPLILVVLCALLVFMIPLIGAGLGMPGLLLAGTKAARGEKPEVGDAFVAFQRPIDHIMMGLLQLSGVLLCCVGALVTAPLFYQGHLLIIERRQTWREAMDVCMTEIKPNWLAWTVFGFVIGLFSQLGAIACVAGVLVTASMGAVAQGYAYTRTLGAKR